MEYLKYLVGYVIYFKDSEEPEEYILQQGTRKQCQTVFDNLHAITYSGSRPVDNVKMFICEVPNEPKP